MKNSNIRSFSIDFNWLNGAVSPDDVYADTDVKKWVKWYKDYGCNNLWTFAVSFNGYAWYDSKLSPKIKGLNRNFTKMCVDEGHRQDLSVFAYHCIGDNQVIREKHPEWCRKNPNDIFKMIFCDDYINYFCKMIKESIEECQYDGLVIDWFRCPANRTAEWEKTEIDLYNQLMDDEFDYETLNEQKIALFENRSIARARRKIKDTVVSVKDIPIWTNQPFEKVDDPVWTGNVLMKEVDYLLNEGPDFGLLEWLSKECGEHTQVVQNLCGWIDHDLSVTDRIDMEKYGLFGFAAADTKTSLPYEDIAQVLEDLKKQNIEPGSDRYNYTVNLINANIKNVKIVKDIFAKKS